MAATPTVIYRQVSLRRPTGDGAGVTRLSCLLVDEPWVKPGARLTLSENASEVWQVWSVGGPVGVACAIRREWDDDE